MITKKQLKLLNKLSLDDKKKIIESMIYKRELSIFDYDNNSEYTGNDLHITDDINVSVNGQCIQLTINCTEE